MLTTWDGALDNSYSIALLAFAADDFAEYGDADRAARVAQAVQYGSGEDGPLSSLAGYHLPSHTTKHGKRSMILDGAGCDEYNVGFLHACSGARIQYALILPYTPENANSA